MSQSPHTREARLLALLFALVSAAIIGGAYAYYRYYRASLTREKSDLLSSIAATKIDEIVAWRAERTRDAASLLDSPLLTPVLARFAAAPGDKELAGVIKKRLEAFVRNNQYRGAYLLGAGGRVYVSAGEPLASPSEDLPDAAELIGQASAAGTPRIGKLHLRARDGVPAFDIVAPVPRLPPGKRLFLLLSADPRVYLYPLVEKWPTNSLTAETLLVRREGDYALFLNPLRHVKSAALKMKLPLANEELPAAMLLDGRRGIVTGYDYRGHKVLAYVSMIPDASLGMVAKVDEAEIFRDLRRYSVLLLLLTAAMLAAAGAGTYLLISRREGEYARGLLAAQAEKERYRLNYETLADKAGDALIIADLADMRILEANAKAAETYGYPAGELRGLHMERLIPENGRAAFRERTSLNVAEGSRHYEAEHLRKDGAVFPAEITATILSTGGRKLMLSIIRDVSERRRAEARIRENEAIFAAFLKHSPVYIFFKDKDLRALRLSDNFSRMLGIPVERALGRTMEELFPSELARGMTADDRRIMEEGRTVTAKETLGGRVYETTKFPVYHEGRPIMLAGFTLDITEREKAEAALRESERRLSTLIATLPGIAYRCRNDGNWTAEFFSEGCLALTGYAAADFVTGRKTSFRDIVLPEDRPALAAAVDKAVKEGGQYRVSYRIRHRSGELRTVWETGAAVRGGTGEAEALEGLITDVTELKRAEERISVQDELLRLTGEMAKVGGWEFDAATGAGTWSDEVARIHGLDPADPTSMSRGLSFYSGESRRRIDQAVKQALEQGKPYELELELTAADGVRKWVRTIGRPMVRDGRTVKVHGTFQDITERKLAEQDRARLLERLDLAAASARLGIWDWDLVRNELIWDDRMLELHGISKKDFKGAYEAWLAAIHPEDKARCEEEARRAIAGEIPYRTEFRVVHPDGAVRHIRAEADIFRDAGGKAVRMVGVNQDITERKLAEQKLLKSEKALREAQHLARIGNWEWDARTDVITWSEEYYRIYGLDPSKPPPPYAEHLKAYTPESAARLDAAVQENLRSGKPYEVDLELTDPGAPARWITARSETVRDAAGAIVGLRGTAQDITERKRAEREREDYIRALGEKNKELEDFLYIASHDLRGPMVNIQGFSQNLQKYCGEIAAGLPPESAAAKPRLAEVLNTRMPEALGFLLGSAARMDGLINSLLKVSRLGRAELSPAPLDMNAFIAELAAGMDFQIREAGAEVRTGELPWCVADKAQLAQVFSNLLENALKYRSPERKPVIEISGALTPDGRAEYSVADNGIGLSEEEAAGRIWTPFYRAQPRGEVKGEGLGLTAAKRIVERHGGEIRAARAAGGGARFTVKLKAWRQA